MAGRRRSDERGGGRRRRAVRVGLAAAGVETLGLWLRSRRLGGDIVVRCRDGHLFTTLWIPAASVKALRLGWWRFQRCPVGPHWSLVTPVNEADLSVEERQAARERHDIRVP